MRDFVPSMAPETLSLSVWHHPCHS